MPWSKTSRPEYDRRFLGYASDMTDAEWALIEPLMPEYERLGRPRTELAGSRQRHFLHCGYRLSLAVSAKSLSTIYHRAVLFLSLAQ